MSASMRHIFFRNDGVPLLIPNTVAFRVYDRKLPLREFARQRVLWVQIIAALENRRIHHVMRTGASYARFDERGFLIEDDSDPFAAVQLTRRQQRVVRLLLFKPRPVR